MKRPSVLLMLIAIACSPSKKDDDKNTDSTQVVTDTVAIAETSNDSESSPEIGPSESSSIYPELLDSPFTEDTLEAEVVGPLFALLKQYDSDRYSELSASYSFSYEEEVGPDDTENVTEMQTRTWYFDSLYNLKCYIQNYEFQGTNGGHPPDRKAIYLFSNDSLIAAYVDQVGVYDMNKVSTRFVANPSKRGIVLTEKRGPWVDSKDYFELTELDSAELAKLSNTFFDEYKTVIQWLKKSKRPTANDEPYTLTVEQGTGDRTFSEEFVLSADVYNKIVAR